MTQDTLPFQRGMAGSNLAGGKWSDDQKAMVDDAIARCVVRFGTYGFTTDDIWARLPGDFPVTKGIAGRLTAARHAGVIHNTGGTRISRRGGEHDHAQRLSIWKAGPK